MWFLVGATSCHVVFSGGHILEMGPPDVATSPLQTTILVKKFNVSKSCFDSWFYFFSGGPHLAMWFLVRATSCHVVF